MRLEKNSQWTDLILHCTSGNICKVSTINDLGGGPEEKSKMNLFFSVEKYESSGGPFLIIIYFHRGMPFENYFFPGLGSSNFFFSISSGPTPRFVYSFGHFSSEVMGHYLTANWWLYENWVVLPLYNTPCWEIT